MYIQVQCGAGHRGEQEPHRFYLGRRQVGVVEILDRWPATDHRYFKVQGDDGGLYILRHDAQSDGWQMTLFDSGSPVGAAEHPGPVGRG